METSEINVNPAPKMQVPLPNSTTVLVLGILSVVVCWCHGIVGLIMSIIALVLAGRDFALYQSNPSAYTPSSLSNLKAGKTIAIIGLVLAAAFILMLLIAILFLGVGFALMPWDLLKEFN
jgi:hypothetical protein